MLREERKAAVAAYKERTLPAGVYVLRCTVTGEPWIGQSPNLEAIRNRLSFTLRTGSHRSSTLQTAWHTYGPEQFVFEVIERVPDDEPIYDLTAHLKRRLTHWQAELGATLV